MARASKTKPWEAVFRRIRCVYDVNYLHAPKPNAADLDAVGELLGIKFPASYRAFAQEFGLGGRLCGLPEILSLTPPDRSWHDAQLGADHQPGEDFWGSVLAATRFMREDVLGWSALTEEAPPGLLERLVVFGADEGEATFVFDPGDVTEERGRECRIYSIGRVLDTQVIANSFTEWLVWIDTNYRSDDDHAPDKELFDSFPFVRKPDSSDPRPMLYERNRVRPKHAPDAADVQRWIAWNNGAILGLARSLREERRHGDFPILADALEEAGCGNEDLLASCRAGDPDVDGAWALTVLLGKPPTQPRD